jgi:thiol-disulfide isomerase/thioredoxin
MLDAVSGAVMVGLSLTIAGCGSVEAPRVENEKSGAATARVMARGPKAPPISLDSVTTSGKVTVPAGKVVIVDFWATWCEPCKKSFPKLQELYVKYKASGLEIAAVSVDDDNEGIAEFAKANGGATFPVGWDSGKKIAAAYTPEAMPTTIIVDKSGRIARTFKGYHDSEIDEIEREIKALF